MQGEDEKRCFAPVVCSTAESSQPSWQQVYPPPQCKVETPRSGIIPSGARGDPGARGPKGDKGDQGERGPNGNPADLGPFNKTFIEALVQRLTVTEEKLKHMTQTFDLCPVFYNNSCFYVFSNESVKMDAARIICEASGGHLANIYSIEHWNAIKEYVRKYKMAGMSFTSLYTGMRLDRSNLAVQLRDGSAVKYRVTWFPGRPAQGASQHTTYIALNIESRPDPRRDAFFDSDDATTRKYLCEI